MNLPIIHRIPVQAQKAVLCKKYLLKVPRKSRATKASIKRAEIFRNTEKQ